MKNIKIQKKLFKHFYMLSIILCLLIIVYQLYCLSAYHYYTKQIYQQMSITYNQLFNKNYIKKTSYLTEALCMKLEITNFIIKETSDYHMDYQEQNENDKSNENQSLQLELLYSRNQPITIQMPTIKILHGLMNFVTNMNYLTYTTDALLLDLHNFIDSPDLLTLSMDKNLQVIKVLSNITTNDVIELEKEQEHLLYNLTSYLILLILLFLLYPFLYKKRRGRTNLYNRVIT